MIQGADYLIRVYDLQGSNQANVAYSSSALSEKMLREKEAGSNQIRRRV